MHFGDQVTVATIRAVFTEEITARQGSVPDVFDDGSRLFLRALLPLGDEVRPGDRVQGGVALRSDGREVFLHPYVFRLVCRNGAIMAQTTQTRHLADLQQRPPEEVLTSLREAIQACCVPEAFTTATRQMRSAQEMAADLGLMLLPALPGLPTAAKGQLLEQIFSNFTSAGDSSLFGLINAVTATARDTRDPQLRWDLEELGGGIAALRTPRASPDSFSRRAERRDQAVLVG
jgi:hypothetical protein